MARARFKCIRKGTSLVAHVNGGLVCEVGLQAQGDGPENKQFFASHPNGHITLNEVDAEVAEMFEVGKEYFIDIVAAE